MTKKNREKWLPALMLAIFIHLVIIIGFVINAKQKQSTSVPKLSTSSEATLATGSQDTPLITERAPQDTLTTTMQVDQQTAQLDASVGYKLNPLMTHQQNVIKSEHKSAQPTSQHQQTSSESQQALANEAASDKAATPSQNNTESEHPSLRTDTNQLTSEAGKPSSNPLTTESVHPALLDRDAPQPSSIKGVDKNYDQTKAETEALNDKLSNAIREVKKRNQQKIDQQRQQQAYGRAVQNVRPIAMTEGVSDTDKVATNALTTPTPTANTVDNNSMSTQQPSQPTQ